MNTRTKTAALCLLTACSISCRTKPTPDKEAPPGVAREILAIAPTASAAAANMIPTLTQEEVKPKEGQPSHLYAVEGAIMAAVENRVGRLVDDHIEWVGQIPKESPGLGDNVLSSVHGRWPDTIAAIYTSGNGRAPQPTYYPLTAKAGSYRVADGGGIGWINGVARVGETTILSTFSELYNVALVPARGPKIVRAPQTAKQAGCKDGEIWKGNFKELAAVRPGAFESTPEGTLVSIGNLCEVRDPAAEVWDKSGTSRIIDLGRWWKKVLLQANLFTLLKGSGDDLFAFKNRWSPVLHYKNGTFEPVPDLLRPIQNIFVSPRGQLHAHDGQAIHRYEGGKWIPLGRLAEPFESRNMVMDDKGTIWAVSSGLHKFREGPGAPFEDTCPNHFVYLYEVSSKNAPDFTFPSTQKALSSFPEASQLGLVEFKDGSNRHLGITAESRAQAEAVIAHLKATMKDEDPRMYCFAPKDPRKIALLPSARTP